MTITISAEQRDALYDRILDRLSGIDDVWLAARREDYDTAKRLATEYVDDLRLVNDALGWGDGTGEEVELVMPPDVLRRAFSRHCHLALLRDAGEAPERAELQQNSEDNHFVVQACRRVLAELDRMESPSD